MGGNKCIQGMAIALVTTACTANPNSRAIREIQIQQNWEIKPGDRIASHQVIAGLGDISVKLNGDVVYAPFTGVVQLGSQNCVLFSSAEVPAYLFRLCGLDYPKIGDVQLGEAIGAGDYLHFATLRKQPDGTWTLVEPARDILERILRSS